MLLLKFATYPNISRPSPVVCISVVKHIWATAWKWGNRVRHISDVLLRGESPRVRDFPIGAKLRPSLSTNVYIRSKTINNLYPESNQFVLQNSNVHSKSPQRAPFICNPIILGVGICDRPSYETSGAGGGKTRIPFVDVRRY